MKIYNNKGLALLPLIMMVVVFGALLGVGIGLVKDRVQNAQKLKTIDTLASAADAIISWSAQSGVLPFWGDNTPDSDIDEFCEVVKNGTDIWNQNLIYAYDSDLTLAANGGICGKTTTGITYGSGGTVAFVILSPGHDRALTSTPNASGPTNGALTLAAEDISKFITLEQLRNAIGCFSTTGGRLTLLTNELPNACVGQSYTAELYAQGGVPLGANPDYTWTHTISAGWIGTTPEKQYLRLAGTPLSVGTETFDATVTDADGISLTRGYTIEVLSCGAGPGPVSQWDFNEGSGPVVRDAAGSNDGSLNGDVAWTGDTPDGGGTALSFDGSGDYILVPDHPSLQLVDELTLTAWIKETAPHTYAKIVSRRSGSYFYFLGVDNGRPYGGIGDGSGYDVTGKSLLMSSDHWNHVAFAYNDVQDRMYMHFAGTELASTVTQNLPPRSGVDVSIGADSEGSSNFFQGYIDDVAIYDAALSSIAIRQLYDNHTHADLVASYYFRGTADDASGNGHDGSISGATWSPDRNGDADRALLFDGNDYVLVGDHGDLRFNQNLTITAWIRETARGSYAKVLSRRSGSYFYFLGVDNGKPYGGIGNGSSYTVTRKSIDMPLDQWHFIALVYDSSANSMHIYYDGIYDERVVTRSLPLMTGVDLSIGADFEGTNNWFEGLIDSVAIYDLALTSEEIRASY
jgi:hypothetical protein